MAGAIFISYRREDSEGEAGRLFDDLTRAFGDKSVFMDVTGINPGVDFRKAIDDNVAACGVLLAVIGPSWLSMPGASGSPRIEEPNDWVGLEIGSALMRDIPVIPVLVHGATMPHPEQLPEKLKNLAYRNSVELTHARWNSDVQLLVNALRPQVDSSAPNAVPNTESGTASSTASNAAPKHAAVGAQAPPLTPVAAADGDARRSNLPLILGVVAAAVLAIGVIGFLIFRPAPHPAPVTAASSASPDHAPSASADLSAFTGTWINNAPAASNNAIYRMEISSSENDQLSIHVWGKCRPADCDWGTQKATVAGQQVNAVFPISGLDNPDGKGRVATLAIQPGKGTLDVSIHNTYTDRGPTHSRWTLTRQP